MDSLKIPDEATPALERIGEEFLASIYSTAMKRQPDNVAALAELGHVYTRLGRYQDGLEVDWKLVEFAPSDPTVRYNLACSQALLGLHTDALESLEKAIELGYDDGHFLRDDEDLAGLRGHPRFEALVRLFTSSEEE